MSLGITLPNGCQIVHGAGSNIEAPLKDQPFLEMHELDLGIKTKILMHDVLEINTGSYDEPKQSWFPRAFRGQLGFGFFNQTVRLPRHVHIGVTSTEQGQERRALLAERILVFNGVALVQLNGLVYVIPPGSLVNIAPGVPHTWAACPPNVKLPDGSASSGEFLMVYNYEEPTGFSPCETTNTLKSVDEYEEFKGNPNDITFPVMTAATVAKEAKLVWGREIMIPECIAHNDVDVRYND